MCVAVPARVLSIGEPAGLSIPARVAVAGTERAVDLALLPDARVGDYVVIHSGYGISVGPRGGGVADDRPSRRRRRRLAIGSASLTA